MKELKFRIWNNSHNEFIRPDYGLIGFCYPLDGRMAVLTTNSDPIEDCDIEQYTGLKDKNGEDIYEGDIVTLNGEWEVIEPEDCSIVTFDNGCFRVGDGCENEAGSYLSDWRVIGNAHQNADLLEKK